MINIKKEASSKTEISFLNGSLVLQAPLPALAREALQRLGVEIVPSTLERDYNAGKSTQVPTGRLIGVKGRISRRIGYDGAYVYFERAA